LRVRYSFLRSWLSSRGREFLPCAGKRWKCVPRIATAGINVCRVRASGRPMRKTDTALAISAMRHRLLAARGKAATPRATNAFRRARVTRTAGRPRAASFPFFRCAAIRRATTACVLREVRLPSGAADSGEGGATTAAMKRARRTDPARTAGRARTGRTANRGFVPAPPTMIVQVTSTASRTRRARCFVIAKTGATAAGMVIGKGGNGVTGATCRPTRRRA